MEYYNHMDLPTNYKSWTILYKHARDIQRQSGQQANDNFKVIIMRQAGFTMDHLTFDLRYLKRRAFDELIAATDEPTEFTPREMSQIIKLLDRFHNQCAEPSELQKKAQRKLKYLYQVVV